MTLNPQQRQSLKEAVLSAVDRGEVCEQIARIYHELQTQIDARRPLCVASGKCCRFEDYGHRLFITTAELARFLHEWRSGTWSDEVIDSLKSWDGSGCPFQIEKLCGVHLIRPFGCRIFFCDSTAADWQQQQYEHFHAELKSLHERFDVPYYYVEWREGLRAVGLAKHP